MKCRDTGVVQIGVLISKNSRTSEKETVARGTAEGKEITLDAFTRDIQCNWNIYS